MRSAEITLPNPAFVEVTASVARAEGSWVEEEGFRGVVDFKAAVGAKYMLQIAGKVNVCKVTGGGHSFSKGDRVVFTTGATPNVGCADVWASGAYHGVALEDAATTAAEMDILLVYPAANSATP